MRERERVGLRVRATEKVGVLVEVRVGEGGAEGEGGGLHASTGLGGRS